MTEEESFQPRSTCYECFRPLALCYCEDIRPVENKTRIVIVQHPREQFHPLNTARIAEMSLRRGEVIRSAPAQVGSALQKIGVSPQAAILYPSRDAEALEELAPEDYPEEVIVLDGTWHHAKTLLRDVQVLQSYRRVRFTPPAPSEYRIRQEPKEDYLSTIESVAHVLSVLEPKTPGIEDLRRTFRRMIDRNLAARKPIEEGTRFRVRPSVRSHRFPDQLHEEEQRQVVVYCEGTSRFSHDRKAGLELSEREPLLIMAERLDGTGSFSVWLKTERRPPEPLLRHLGISFEELKSRAVEREDALAELRGWLKAEDQLAVFNASSGAILEELGLRHAPPLQMKGAYCDWALFLNKSDKGRKWGGMEQMIARHEMPLVPSLASGRGSQRIAESLAILRWLRAEAEKHCSSIER